MDGHTDDKWEILQRAKEAGWVDPGYTETLTETVLRALEYLENRQPPTTANTDPGER